MKILISQLRNHGDIIRSFPLVEAIKEVHPDWFVGYTCYPNMVETCALCHSVDKIFPQPRLTPVTNIQGGTRVLDCSILDYRYRYHYKGDKLECFKLKYARLYPFPEFNGKFVPNALIWNRISSSKKLRYFAEIVHLYDWSEDSMSRTIIKNRRSTPDAYLLYYSELSNYDIPLWYKIRSAINYWRFAPCSQKGLLEKLRGISLWKSLLGLPPGVLFYIRDSFIKE